jgi:drug/metabolite transporter (DMT)-like permease
MNRCMDRSPDLVSTSTVVTWLTERASRHSARGYTCPPVRSRRLVGVGLVVVSATAFGALGVLARVAYDDGAQPLAVLTFRFCVAGACFIALRMLRPAPRPPRRALVGLVAMGACYLLQSLCYFTAVEHAPPGLVALLLYSYPAIVVAAAALFFDVRLTRTVVVACAVAIAGMVFVVGPSVGSGDAIGITLGFAAAIVYAVYILLGSRVLEAADSLWASTVIMSTAGAGYLAFVLVAPDKPSLPSSASGWWAMIAIALLCTVLAGLTFLAGLARVGPADASTISTIEPVVSVVLSAIVTGEAITGWTVIGGSLVVGSVVALSRASTAPLAEAAPPA